MSWTRVGRIVLAHLALACALGLLAGPAPPPCPPAAPPPVLPPPTVGPALPAPIAAAPDEPAPRSWPGLRRICRLPGESPSRDYWRQRVQFVDERRGWLRTGEGLWRTSNGGRTWRHVLTATTGKAYGSERNIESFQFLDANRGWALLDDEIHRTSDGGSTWVRSAQPPSCLGLYALAFGADGIYGWAAGVVERRLRKNEALPNRFTLKCCEDGKSTGVFPAAYFTRDGGASWHRQPMPRDCGDVYYVCSADADHAWVIGQAGFFYLKDGRWRASDSDAYDAADEPRVKGLEIAIGLPTFAPINLFFLSARDGWLVNSNGALSATHDGGRTWHDLVTHDDIWGPEYSEQCFVEVYFANRRKGFAIDDSGDLFASRDGGETWARVAAGAGLRDLFFLTPKQGWAVSETALYRLEPNEARRRQESIRPKPDRL